MDNPDTTPARSAFCDVPRKLVADCILAGCPENGIVLDPFMGSGTTGIVARKFNRKYIGFELNPEYIQIADKRLKKNSDYSFNLNNSMKRM